MIEFKRGDINLEAIKNDSGLARVSTTEDYRVYGCRNGHGNPPVLLSYPADAPTQEDIDYTIGNITKFLGDLGIELEMETYSVTRGEDSVDYRIHIGLRLDIRQNIALASAVLKTIVYAIEGVVLDLDPEEVGFSRVKKFGFKTEDV